jgi:predicted DNA-binding transcriptional regulator AlpA
MASKRQEVDRRPPTLTEIRELWPPTVDVRAAGRVFGLSRSHAYELVSRGEFPAKVIKVGSRYRVITASIIEVLSGEAA